jgi:uncharacterized membrane protein HdeD (DUF308 family)
MPQTWTQRTGRSDAGASWNVALPETTEDVRSARRWLMITGVLSIAAGAVAIAVPPIASVTMTIFIGWLLVFSGVLMGVAAFRAESDTPRWIRVLNAALNLLVGLYVVIFPLSGTITLTFLLAAWFFASGVLLVWGAWHVAGTPEAWLMGFNGVLSLILGILIAVDLPSSAAWAIGLLVGINLVFWGVRMLMASALMKRLLEDNR